MECFKERYVDNLNKEVIVLRDENMNLRLKLEELERRLSVDRSLERSLDHENHLLKHDLSKVGMISRTLEIEKDHAILDAELELTKLQKRLKQTELDCEKIEQEKYLLTEQLTELEQSSKMIDIDLQDSQDIVARIQDDKLRLTQRIEKLTANERALVLEIERIRRREKGSNARESVSQVEQYMRGIENDRDYWKNEAELLRELQQKGTHSSLNRPSSPLKQTSSNNSPKKSHSSEKQRLRELEREKEDLKKQLKSLREDKSISPLRNRSPSPNMRDRSPNKDPKKSSDDIVQIKRERDELRNLLNKLEKRVVDIQGSVKMLTQERDRFCKLYEDSKQENHHMQKGLMVSQEDGGRATSQIRNFLSRAENERDILAKDLARAEDERDALLERFKGTVDTATQDKYLLERKIEDLHETIRCNRVEKKEMAEKTDSLRLKIANLEDELKNLEVGARQSISKLENEKEGSGQLKQQMQKLETQLKSAERQVVNLSSQLAKSEERVYLQEQKIQSLTDDLHLQRDDFVHLRGDASRLNEDKDQLKSTLHEASQRIRQLENDLRACEDELKTTRSNLTMTEQQLGKVSEALANRENENRKIRKKTDHASGQVEECQRKVAILSRENERLSENVDELHRLNKNLKHELTGAIDEREELRSQVQNYIGEVKIAEDLLADREEAQNELLKRHKMLSEDADVFKKQFETCRRELNDCKQEILDREHDLERLQCKLGELEKENMERKLCNRELESRINHLGLVVTQNKEQTKLIEHERDELMSDLTALRDLCGRIEKSKEELEKELDTRNIDMDLLQANIDDLEHENETLKGEIRVEKENVRNIETILHASQSQEQNYMDDIQEKSSTLVSAQNNIQMLEEKLQQGEREIQRLKNKNNDLERESERLQRNLSSEKFEKDRALSELRINSLSPSYKPSCYLATGSHRPCSPCRACSPGYN